MKFTSAALVSTLAAAAVAAPAPAPAPASEESTGGCAGEVIDKVNTFSGSMTSLDENIKSFKAEGLSSVPDLLKIQIGNMDLAQEVEDTANKINECDNFNDDDSAAVSATVLRVIPKIKRTLQDIQDKKNEFDHAILGIASAGFVVEADLKLLKKNTDQLSSNLKDKSSDIITDALDVLVKQIDGWFDKAIETYKDDPIFHGKSDN
ncbi:hypothetical protein TRICI_006795 [Trichomonascus ciferrii]|uniref:Uncharacterized protein n=1 Tax=Trichomonascus ciferrii TaxID=44093 RepID=A0A642UFW7_9ASCO|nr:hypothetical protein TRICI_006795 [Trichomonascus ciferrii]